MDAESEPQERVVVAPWLAERVRVERDEATLLPDLLLKAAAASG
jgi:hypothetical protein